MACATSPLVKMVSVPGVPGLCLFTITPDCSEAWIIIFETSSMVQINLESGTIVNHFEIPDDFKKITASAATFRYFAVCSVIDSYGSPKSFGLNLFTDELTKKSFAVSFKTPSQLNGPCNFIDERELGVDVFPKSVTDTSTNFYLFEDATGVLYYLGFWLSAEHEANRRTIFHVVKLTVDEYGKIYPMIIISQRTISDLWFQPFVSDNAIYFLPFNGDKRRVMCVPFDDTKTQQIFVIAGDDSGRRPPLQGFSVPSSFGDHSIIYQITKNGEHGSLWTLDLKQKRWNLHVELVDHVTAGPGLVSFYSRKDRIFVNSTCDTANCNLAAHLFHFAVPCHHGQSKIVLSVEQLGALYSPARVRFLHGGKKSGKSTVLLLAVMRCVKDEANPNEVRIFVSSPSKLAEMRSFLSNIYPNFNPNNVTLQRKKFPQIPNTCHLFIDDLKVLTLELQTYLLKRTRFGSYSFVVIDHQISPGLDHPRDVGLLFSWHRLTAAYDNDSALGENMTNNNLQTHIVQDSNVQSEQTPKKVIEDMKTFMAQSQVALNQFYPDWWVDVTDKATVCIPACLDVGASRYRGPTDPAAAGFDSNLFAEKSNHVIGQSAEEDFLYFFQQIDIGGLLISGFDTQEFAKNCHVQYLFRACKIEQFEIDFMFIHPRLGIYLIEVKGAKELKNKSSNQYEKAKKQLDRMLEQVPKIMKELTGKNCDIPIYTAICFPFASMKNVIPTSDHEFINKNALRDKNILRKIFANKMQATTIALVDPLHQFACVVAGYRSTEFLSAGQNALAIHKMIENQSFHKMRYETNVANQGIFLTNEQLAIIDCQHSFQIIVGPPGTGKTLILLTKALLVAKEAKKGTIRFLTAPGQLCCKFQKFFESHSENMVRFPVVDTEFRAEIDDDVFFDEVLLTDKKNTDFLRKRTHAKGCTIAAMTGLGNPLQILHAETLLEELGLSVCHVIRMNTIIRSSGNIFNEVKKAFPTGTPLYLGHSIKGPNVKSFTEINHAHIFERMLVEIRQFLKHGVPPKHICVITEGECFPINGFLASHGIACGSIEEQLMNPSLIAVDMFSQTLSFEWPMVVVVSQLCIDLYGSFLLIAASRCMVQLVIVKTDYIATQKYIDKVLAKAKGGLSNMTGTEFISTITNAINSDQIVETGLRHVAATISAIRHNYCPPDLPPKFKSASLFELFDKISKEDTLCQVMLQDQTVLLSVWNKKHGRYKMTETVPTFFEQLWSNIPAEEKASRWRIFKNLADKLASVCSEPVGREEMLNHVANAYQRQQLQERSALKMQLLCPAWNVIIFAVQIILMFCEWQ